MATTQWGGGWLATIPMGQGGREPPHSRLGVTSQVTPKSKFFFKKKKLIFLCF
jgi:hypothetical protein